MVFAIYDKILGIPWSCCRRISFTYLFAFVEFFQSVFEYFDTLRIHFFMGISNVLLDDKMDLRISFTFFDKFKIYLQICIFVDLFFSYVKYPFAKVGSLFVFVFYLEYFSELIYGDCGVAGIFIKSFAKLIDPNGIDRCKWFYILDIEFCK